MLSAMNLRNFTRPLMLVATMAVLGLGMLGVYEYVHDVYEPDCPGRTSGNPAACPLCSHFQLLTAEESAPVLIPQNENTATPVCETGPLFHAVWQPISNPGRSPPVYS